MTARPGRMLTAALALAASACAPLQSNEPPPDEYLLHAPAEADVDLAALPRSLGLPRPDVPAGLDGDRIRLIRAGRRLDHYADARWAAPLPDLLHDVLSATLARAAGRLTAAEDSPGGVRYSLRVRLASFHPVYDRGADRPPELRVELVATLVDHDRGRVVAAARAGHAERAAANRLDTIVGGLERLLHRTFLEAAGSLARQWRGGAGAGRPRAAG